MIADTLMLEAQANSSQEVTTDTGRVGPWPKLPEPIDNAEPGRVEVPACPASWRGPVDSSH